MKAGKDKTQVLRDMSERAGVPDVASFVTVLIQSATFGTSSCGSASRLCCRNARQTDHASRRKGKHLADEDDPCHNAADSSAAPDHSDRTVDL